MSTPVSDSPNARPLSLGVIFLTLYIDLVGFSIFFPLFPGMLEHYLALGGESSLLAGAVHWVENVTGGAGTRYTEVLLGGVLGSLYSLLQFVFAPIWGARSDRQGRRPVLLLTVAGTAVSYILWALSGSFGLFIISRLVGGAMSGNLSVATAAVADVTTRANRAKGMGLIGAAFGLGFITGPAIGGFAARWNLLESHPEWAAWGINPFTVPALIALVLSLANLGWIAARFKETRQAATEPAPERTRNPLRALYSITDPVVQRTNLTYFLFVLCFSGMELTLSFLAVERLGYTTRQLPLIFVFVGIVSIITQGGLVRRLAPKWGEKRMALFGIGAVALGFALLAGAQQSILFYLGLAGVALGSGFANAAFSALVSLYAGAEAQGRVLGIFRSLGSLSRAIGPIAAGILYWSIGSGPAYLVGAALLLPPLALALKLPKPQK